MINDLWNGRRYYSLDSYLKNAFGEKLYKIPLSARVTCPNRDGKLGYGGCIFCSEGGSGDFAGDSSLSITEQIDQGIDRLSSKFSDGNYIAYFQSFTSTYADIEYLREIFHEAIKHPRVRLLSIATRPDCLGNDVLDLLSELNKIKPVWVELGLQTSKKASVEFINRGYENQVYEEAMQHLQERNIETITHIILGLPNESREDMVNSVKYAVANGTRGIKLQLLHVLKNTGLASYYESGSFEVLSQEEYLSILSACLEVIPQDLVIHRITGDGPKELLIAPLWSGHKKQVLNNINHFLKENNSFQGKML